ncbi:hypothetical protein UNDKW_5787 [Undibacterium sp. KW1]|uniref:hypothetical protein n=1 Tax=Undibacterium sp. KW1 TaxID=2058624 RepID=UPI001331E9AE|nr:hypothetical protein [Undibacterium sp. KW1]BBB64060.1 hypothetical protein UNDKW_5787 [Undibacterium sp. KW1]
MKKYLVVAYAFICLAGMAFTPSTASAVDLPSDAIRLYAKNPQVDVLLKISYETKDQADIDTFRKVADDLGLRYELVYSFSAASDKATTKKWKLQISNKVAAQGNNADKQVSALYETVRSKGGSFSWEVTTIPK